MKNMPAIAHVEFEDNGGTGTDTQVVPIHGKVQKSEDPTRRGFDFTGWYADEGLKDAYDFDSEVTGDITIYAGWKKKSETPLAKAETKGDSGVKITWTTVKGADGYDLFFARCNHGGKKIALKKVKTIKKDKPLAWTKAKLKKGTSSGKIKAKAKGSCKIYIFAADGVRKTVKVTVK